MAICPDCKLEMLNAIACTLSWVRIDGKWYRRSTKAWGDPGTRCGDCGAIISSGMVHHSGSDIERCPKCGGQFLGCTCGKVEYFADRKPNKLEEMEHERKEELKP